MKTLKRLALRALLSKEQRAVILNSVAYSEHKYRVHGDVDGAPADPGRNRAGHVHV